MRMTLETFSGETLQVPEGLRKGYGVLLIYRGHWGPFCSQQLADFQSLWKEFQAEEIAVIGASIDPLEKAKETVEKLGIAYPVAFGLDSEEVSRLTGAYCDVNKKFLRATGFLVRPDLTIEIVCYSSGTIGRFVVKDVLSLVRFYKSRQKE
jgi:peroxiredoxin